MRLKNDNELANTQRKLEGLEKLIQDHEKSPTQHPAERVSIESMKKFAKKLRAEIDEYERSRQTASTVKG